MPTCQPSASCRIFFALIMCLKSRVSVRKWKICSYFNSGTCSNSRLMSVISWSQTKSPIMWAVLKHGVLLVSFLCFLSKWCFRFVRWVGHFLTFIVLRIWVLIYTIICNIPDVKETSSFVVKVPLVCKLFITYSYKDNVQNVLIQNDILSECAYPKWYTFIMKVGDKQPWVLLRC